MTDLEAAIVRLAQKKQGNKEVAIFYDPDFTGSWWRIDIGNPTGVVMLGEVSGEISVSSDSLAGSILAAEIAIERFNNDPETQGLPESPVYRR